jgi:periplasmic divalent cation tolerance protein
MALDPPDTVVVALTMAPDSDTAAGIAERLLSESLIACANIVPGATSIYRWEGEIRSESEVLVILKSVAGARRELGRRVAELHPYDVPEVLFLEATGGAESYLDWVRAEVRTP